LKNNIQAPSGVRQVFVVDINNDGLMDILFIICPLQDSNDSNSSKRKVLSLNEVNTNDDCNYMNL